MLVQLCGIGGAADRRGAGFSATAACTNGDGMVPRPVRGTAPDKGDGGRVSRSGAWYKQPSSNFSAPMLAPE